MTAGTARMIVLIGAALLIVGVFLPLVEIPKRGTINMLDMGWPAWVTMALGVAAGLLALVERTRHALWPGIAALGLLAYAYVVASTEIERARQRLGGSLGDDPLGAVQDLAASGSRFEYGWAVLTFGGLFVIAGALIAWRRR